MRALLLVLLAFAALVPTAHAQPRRARPPAAQPALAGPTPFDAAAFSAYVERVLAAFSVPGAAVAVVRDGRVVHAKGYGVRTLGQPAPVTASTRFGIASNTKAFTATALALLVEEGKIEWDAPVVRYLPGFALSDPYVTAHLTVRDLLVHRSGLGLGAGDLLWWPGSTYSRKEIVRRLRFVPLAAGFRETFAYDNVLYSVAGEVIEAVTGQTWERFVAERILAPAGMRESVATYTPTGEIATPHAGVGGTMQPVAPDTSANTNPAGGILSTANDVATWMLVQLDSGRVAGGARLFSPATTRELWSLVTPLPTRERTPPGLEALRTNFAGYGLGFFLNDYRGRKLVWHTGGLPGYVSKIAFLPEIKAGVAVLTNAESSLAFEAITYAALDGALGAGGTDWLAALRPLNAGTAASATAFDAPPVPDSLAALPTLPLARYAGTYTDPWYGDVIVEAAGDGLAIRFVPTPALVGALVPYRGDTFVARWHDRALRADAFVTFALTPSGKIGGVTMAAVTPAVDFSFDFHDLALKPAMRR